MQNTTDVYECMLIVRHQWFISLYFSVKKYKSIYFCYSYQQLVRNNFPSIAKSI